MSPYILCKKCWVFKNSSCKIYITYKVQISTESLFDHVLPKLARFRYLDFVRLCGKALMSLYILCEKLTFQKFITQNLFYVESSDFHRQRIWSCSVNIHWFFYVFGNSEEIFMLMRQNVNNDVSKDPPISFRIGNLSECCMTG